MKSMLIPLALASVAIGLAPVTAQTRQATPARPGLDQGIMKVQVILDRLGFAPGVIDGRRGQSLTAAIKGFQEASGLPRTGQLDRATLARLQRFNSVQPTRTLALTERGLMGPFVNPTPDDPAEQAKLPALAYRSALEKLAEMFHTTPRVLAELNPPDTRLRPGSAMVFPNVLPSSRDYDAGLPAQWRQTLSDLNVSSQQPIGARVVVDKSDGVLKVYGQGDRLVAQFPATMGSEHDPLPLGRWTIKGASYNPVFHYNPDLFWDGDAKDEKQKLPAGPNNPVGVIWLDLSKPHYGIHGTPNPETIGRAESHGCIRLSNWDAARLSMMVKAGTPAIFQE